jgi:hypothetical protein
MHRTLEVPEQFRSSQRAHRRLRELEEQLQTDDVQGD